MRYYFNGYKSLGRSMDDNLLAARI